MRHTAMRSVSVFGVGLGLAAGLGQGDMRLPMAQAPTQYLPVPKQHALPLPFVVVPHAPPLDAPGNVMPHSYLVFGLRTGPGGMAFTDRNGAVILVPPNVRLHMEPFTTSPTTPHLSPPTFTPPALTPPTLTPPLFTLPGLTPPEYTPKK